MRELPRIPPARTLVAGGDGPQHQHLAHRPRNQNQGWGRTRWIMKQICTQLGAWRMLLLPFSAVVLAACSGGGSPVTPTTGTDNSNPNCNGSCANTASNLAVADVQR